MPLFAGPWPRSFQRSSLLLESRIASHHARGDAGEDFPDDGAGLLGDFGDWDVRSEQFHLGAFANITGGGDIGHDLVHGDAPENGAAATVDPDVGTLAGNVARIAVTITDANGGHARRSVGDELATVGNAVTGGQRGKIDYRVDGDVISFSTEKGKQYRIRPL